MQTSVLKRAWIRNQGIPAGVEAKGRINCPCGNAPESSYGDGNDVRCTCGVVYSSLGWILSQPKAVA